MFGPLGAEIKMDSRGLLSLVLVCVFSVCALKNFRKERTSGDGHCPSSLSDFCRVRTFTAVGGLTSSFFVARLLVVRILLAPRRGGRVLVAASPVPTSHRFPGGRLGAV
jgi:hypothetical protein